MKSIVITVAAALVVAASPSYTADTKIQSTESGKPHMEFAPCPAKGQFRLFVRSGEIRIVGSTPFDFLEKKRLSHECCVQFDSDSRGR